MEDHKSIDFARTPARTRGTAPTEREFTEQIRHLAGLLGYHRYHAWTSVRSPSGWPDEVLVRPPRIIFAELKSDTGKVSAAQTTWLSLLEQCDVEVYVWRPSMLDEIATLLRPLERPR